MQMSPDPELLAMITSILVTILAVIGILAVITYIFSSLGFYTLGQAPGHPRPGPRLDPHRRRPVDLGQPGGSVCEPDRV